MARQNLVQVLMNIEDITKEEAQSIISQMLERMYDGEDPEDLLSEYGLEPDYIEDLLY